MSIFHLKCNIPVCSESCTLQWASSQLNVVFVPIYDPESGRVSCKLSQGYHAATCHSCPPSQQNHCCSSLTISSHFPLILLTSHHLTDTCGVTKHYLLYIKILLGIGNLSWLTEAIHSQTKRVKLKSF